MTTRSLRLIGYWLGPESPGWPDVRTFVDPRPDPALRDRVVAYLRGGTVFVAAGGTSPCRICGRANGSAELTDGVRFAWPEGLAHYVEAHDVRLPTEVTAAMITAPQQVDVTEFEHRLLDTDELVIDADWWRDLGSGPRDRLLLLWEEHVRAPFPPHLRGRDVDGEDVVALDSDIAGCVSSALAGHLDERRHRSLVRCLVAVEKVVPLIGDDDRALEYCERLREMAGLVVRLRDATTGRGLIRRD